MAARLIYGLWVRLITARFGDKLESQQSESSAPTVADLSPPHITWQADYSFGNTKKKKKIDNFRIIVLYLFEPFQEAVAMVYSLLQRLQYPNQLGAVPIN